MNSELHDRSVAPPSPAGEAAKAVSHPRLHHLDAVRAFALLLGVFFHAAESFGPDNHYWAIVDCSPSTLLESIRFACHSFRMELFFLISGFFARLLLLRRGPGGFVRNRLLRILVPFLIGWALIYPMLVAIWLWGASVTNRLPQFGVPPEAIDLPVWQLTLGFFLTGSFLKKFDLTHLWFLHQLLVIYALALGVRQVATSWLRLDRLAGLLDRWFARAVSGPGTLYWLMLPSIPILLLMRSWGVDTPKESLLPQLPTTLLYGYFFWLGWLLHRQPDLQEQLARRWPAYCVIGVVTWCGLLAAQGKMQWSRPAFTFCYAHMMWGFVLGWLGLFARFCRNPNAWTRYIADASYWIYLAHLPLVVAMQVYIGRVALPWPIKYAALCAAALLILFVSYHLLVRDTFIGSLLNGHRYPRTWPWQHDRAQPR